jgi:hypothetical protein
VNVSLESLACSPYRDVMAAFVAASGSIGLVKATELLHKYDILDKVRS